MLYWTIQWVIISLVLIMLIHNLYTFFKTNLTVPKVRDLVTKPTERYNEILGTIQEEKNDSPKADMQNELQSFLQELKRPAKTPEIAPANDGGASAFASY